MFVCVSWIFLRMLFILKSLFSITLQVYKYIFLNFLITSSSRFRKIPDPPEGQGGRVYQARVWFQVHFQFLYPFKVLDYLLFIHFVIFWVSLSSNFKECSHLLTTIIIFTSTKFYVIICVFGILKRCLTTKNRYFWSRYL